MSESPMNPELRDFETSLQQLRPQPNNVNRDAILFRAGQDSLRRTLQRWRFCSLASLAIAAALAAWWFAQTPLEPEVRIVQVGPSKPSSSNPKKPKDEQPPPPQQTRPSNLSAREHPPRDLAYYRLQEHVLRWGLDGLPASTLPPATSTQETSLASLRAPQPAQNEELSAFSAWLISIGDE